MGKLMKFAALGAVVLVGSVPALQAIGSDAAAGTEVAKPRPSTEVTSTDPAPVDAEPKVGSSILEQAIFDAFPAKEPSSRSAKEKMSNAADFLSMAINSEGHFCARPIEAQQASADLYGVGCVTRRDGYGRANYLLNIRSGEVTPI